MKQRKNIAVLLHGLSVEYALSIVDGITEYFADKDSNVIIAQTNIKFLENSLYDYQFWASTNILNSKDIDGIISISSSYTAAFTIDDFKDLLGRYTDKPVISIGVNPELENIHYTICNTTKIYNDVVKHLKDVHGCKKFAFMSANPTKSTEALDRFESFKLSLKNNGLEFDSEMVYDGYFTKTSALEAMKKKIKTKDDVHFDAMLVANDLMAVGVMEHLTNLGFSIPDDIKIIGFDNTSHSSMCKPTLSTIDQQITRQGYEAAKVIDEILSGKATDREIKIDLAAIYRQSCGCISIEDKNLSYKDSKGQIQVPVIGNQDLLNRYLQTIDDMNRIPTLMDMLKTDRTLRELSFQIKYIIDCACLSAMAIVYYDYPVIVEKGSEFVQPEIAYLSMYADNEQDFLDFYDKDISFDPRENILPENLLNKFNGKYILYPIFADKKQYGYVVTKLNHNHYNTINVYLRIIINSLVQAFLYTEEVRHKTHLTNENKSLQERNTNLNYQSIIDELTQILNRRSFLRYGQKLISFSTEIGTRGLVIFADMDGLKTINDTYGHEIGDISIATEAQVLKEAFRKADIVGRLSGDEFAIVAAGLSIETFEFYLRKKIEKLNKKFSEEKKLKFTLSISLGAVEFGPKANDLKELLTIADSKLYQEKEQKHAARDAK